MNKKEQAAFEQLQKDVKTYESLLLIKVRLAKALSWTRQVDPDVAPPEGVGKLTTGFLFNHYSRAVAPSCSSIASHSFGNATKTTSQGPVWLYSTRLRALQAMRHELEKQYAIWLADVDIQIERELDSQ